MKLIGFAFRWTKLKGRALTNWAQPLMMPGTFGCAHQDEAKTFVEVPADTAAIAIGPFVHEATRGLFVLFEGHTIAAEM